MPPHRLRDRVRLARPASHVVSLLVLLAILPGPGGPPASAQTAPHREIYVNIPAFSLYLYEDGVRVATYPIGVGRIVNPSQLGTTEIINKVVYPTYYPPDWYVQGLQPIPPGPENPVGTRWLGLGFRGYGIHGTNNPDSIGTAASAGCVRMLNEHVEELFTLVDVGTKVTFLYETVEAWRDPLTHTPYLRVYRDIYRQGTNTLARAMAALERIGVTERVDPDALGALLGEAAGLPRAVPFSVPLYLDGRLTGVTGVRFGERILLPLDRLVTLTGDTLMRDVTTENVRVQVSGRAVGEVTWIGSRPYVGVQGGAEAVGLVVASAGPDGVYLERISVRDERGEELAVRAFASGKWLLLPVQDLGGPLGVPISWDPATHTLRVGNEVVFGAQVIGGKVHLPHDRLAALLGIQIRWEPGERWATVRVPRVHIAAAVEERGFYYDGDVYVPLAPIAERLGYTLGWHQESQTAFLRGIPVKGFVRSGRYYASVAALGEVVPSVAYRWSEEEFRLELLLGQTDQGARRLP